MDSDFLMYALTSLEHPETWSIIPDDELPGYYALCAFVRPGSQKDAVVTEMVVVASHGDVEALMAVRAAFGAAYMHHSETSWEFTGEETHLPEEIA